ncbi:hypothetical protein A167_03680 [Alcanivorax sp. S71-1-4]|uniref:DUF2513 domain-containing protein n=1 Tax=Alcanivorax sp. S71-1-4 TaxID=1177159 RepID=UPI00135A2AE0|nr:DUF2513 domain-containing protein [Alcanivorax sp. S71-1-4]KAF0804618.1 hypothetical protein A167_03680 [Alcanivorax sp. S71-1-4]
MEIVREILISIAEKGSADPSKEIDHDVLQYHLWIMQEASLIGFFSRFGPEGGAALHSLELTWAGNEFLEAARSDSVWNKAKAIVLDKTGAISFEVMKTVLVNLAMKAVE